MKKFLSLALVLVLFVSAFALAEGIDVTAMTDEELHAIVNSARNELAKRERTAAGDTVLFEQDGVTVYLTGEYTVNNWAQGAVMELEAVVVNDTETDIGVYIDSCTVNGWEVTPAGCIVNIGAGKKKKDGFEIRLYDADLSSYEEITDIDFEFRVSDAASYKTIFKVDAITVHFNE